MNRHNSKIIKIHFRDAPRCLPGEMGSIFHSGARGASLSLLLFISINLTAIIRYQSQFFPLHRNFSDNNFRRETLAVNFKPYIPHVMESICATYCHSLIINGLESTILPKYYCCCLSNFPPFPDYIRRIHARYNQETGEDCQQPMKAIVIVYHGACLRVGITSDKNG